MAVSLPYLVSYKNVPALFEKIASAKIPDTFSRSFLETTIGLKSTADRALIPLLRTFGFLDQSGKPTDEYRLLKGDKRKVALADGIRRAYAPLFDANDAANTLTGDPLKGLVAQIAGTDADLTNRIANTFLALTRIADFSGSLDNKVTDEEGKEKDDKEHKAEDRTSKHDVRPPVPRGLRTEFNYNIHVHLPSNGSEETYLNIFNAIRKTFQ